MLLQAVRRQIQRKLKYNNRADHELHKNKKNILGPGLLQYVDFPDRFHARFRPNSKMHKRKIFTLLRRNVTFDTNTKHIEHRTRVN